MTADKRATEDAVLGTVRQSTDAMTPFDVRTLLEKRGLPGDAVRSAIARLVDSGAVTIDSDMKIRLNETRGERMLTKK